MDPNGWYVGNMLTAPNLNSTDVTIQVEQPNRGTNLDI